MEYLRNDKLLVADIGGSHITAAVFNTAKQEIIQESYVRLEVDSNGIADDILQTWSKALRDSLELSGAAIAGLGVAMPGPFDYQQGISYITGLNKYETIFGINVKAVFAEALGLTADRVIFRNDAEAAVAGEVLAGAGKGFNTVMGLTLGSGFGSACYANGVCKDLNLGSFAYKGAIADDHLSTRWFLKRYAALTGKILTGVKEMAELAETDWPARQVFKEFGVNMSVFLREHLAALRPDVLVIGGSISKASKYFLRFVKPGLTGTRVTVSTLGDYAALVGAAESFNSLQPSMQL